MRSLFVHVVQIRKPKIVGNGLVDPEIFAFKYVKRIRIHTLNVNISGSIDPIDEISFRSYSPDQGLSKEPIIIENGSVDLEIFAFKDDDTDSDMK